MHTYILLYRIMKRDIEAARRLAARQAKTAKRDSNNINVIGEMKI